MGIASSGNHDVKRGKLSMSRKVVCPAAAKVYGTVVHFELELSCVSVFVTFQVLGRLLQEVYTLHTPTCNTPDT